MVRLPGRLAFLTYERIWVWDGTPFHTQSDILRYLRLTSSQAAALGGHAEANYTLISDLTETEETLLGHMTKNYRYEIRRAAKEGASAEFFDAAALRADPAVLSDLEQTYMNFCDSLGNEALKKDYSRKKVDSYLENDCIFLSRGSLGNALVYHLYETDGETAVLCYSASDFRSADVDQNAAGRLNKFLHWADMQKMRIQGVRTYDWGNVSSLTNYNGIDVFKAGFGGKPTTLYNMFVGDSHIGRLAVAMMSRRKGK